MTTNARRILEEFDELGEAEQHDVLIQLLRKSIKSPYPSLTEAELMSAADEIFLELDQGESSITTIEKQMPRK
jgi:hypothetical protein